MARIIEITDLSAPELAPYAGLTHAQLRSRRDPDRAVIIVESAKAIACALDAGLTPLSLLMERRRLAAFAAELEGRCGDVPVYTADRDVLAGLTGYELTRGVLCAMARPAPLTLDEVCRGARRVAVLENLADPSNVGAVFRCAAALGMDGVLVSPSCCDPLYRRAIRVSMGAVFQVPWAPTGPWPGPALEQLRALGFRTAALALTGDSISLDDPALAGAERLALLLGSEGEGLSPAAVAACDRTVRIPMAHGVDSLNVAAAAAVAFWQVRTREIRN